MSSPKEAFLNNLRKKLSRLPQEEIDSALAYYEEYLEEAGDEHLEETLRELCQELAQDAALHTRAIRSVLERM